MGNLLGRLASLALVLVGLLAFAAVSRAESFIVKDGEANGEIVISRDKQRPRMAALAALELQYYIQKISGARLPIITEPSGAGTVKLYVGASEHISDNAKRGQCAG